MSPPIEEWPAHQLPDRVMALPNGKRRKRNVDLEKCALMELVQYSCNPREVPGKKRTVIHCEPIVRTFRKYVVKLQNVWTAS